MGVRAGGRARDRVAERKRCRDRSLAIYVNIFLMVSSETFAKH